MKTLSKQRGSVFIAALIFSAVLAISLATYLQLAMQTNRLADRSYAFNAAQNLADTAIEQTLWCLNNSAAFGTGGFTSLGSNQYTATISADSLSRGASGQAIVWINNNTSTPHVVVKATITTAYGANITKYGEGYAEQRSLSVGGMVARNGIYFNGHSVIVDSWNSGNTTAYSTGVRHAMARFSSPELIDMQNAKVFGYANIGSDDYSGLHVGATGILSGNFSASNGDVDYTRVTRDFTANFPVLTAPSGGTSLGSITNDLTISTAGVYNCTGIDINNKTLSITVPGVILVVNGNVTYKGNGGISINTGSSLTMYVSGDITQAGSAEILNGAASMNLPANLTIIGTRTDTQVDVSGTYSSWTVQGNSFMSAIIYGPNANITIGGAGETFGSVVGNKVYMNSGNFHQDEWLGLNRTSGLWQLSKWRSLDSQSDRTSSSEYATWSTYVH